MTYNIDITCDPSGLYRYAVYETTEIGPAVHYRRKLSESDGYTDKSSAIDAAEAFITKASQLPTHEYNQQRQNQQKKKRNR